MICCFLPSRTFRQDCKSYIALKIDKGGSEFEISNMSMEHNHEISQVCYHLSVCAQACCVGI